MNANDTNPAGSESAYILWQTTDQFGKSPATDYQVTGSGGQWNVNQESRTAPADKVCCWVVDDPIGPTEVPGPLPLVGAALAFRWSRRLRGLTRSEL